MQAIQLGTGCQGLMLNMNTAHCDRPVSICVILQLALPTSSKKGLPLIGKPIKETIFPPENWEEKKKKEKESLIHIT